MHRKVRHEWIRTLASTRLGWLEVAIVAVTVLAIQFIVFRGYYAGTTAPYGDFLGLYGPQAFAWWHDGGVLHPPDWMPYLWGGYPSVVSIQSGSWYLPGGVAALFQFDVRSAASLQAVHVAFAGLGVYILGRRAGFGRIPAAFGLVAYSFSMGFYDNAPYVDIVRGHALAPWVLLCLSPLWPWRRVWSIPAAAVILWQAFVGVYPGMLVAFAYAGVAWAITWQLSVRPPARGFAIPALTAGVTALLLSMPKYLPLLKLQDYGGDVADTSVVFRATAGTFLLPSYLGLPGVATFNSFFVPATVLLLATLASLRSVAVRAALVAAVVAMVLSIPQMPFHSLIEALPGIGVSRFVLNDFRPFYILPLILAAMAGLARIQAGRFYRVRNILVASRVVVLLLVPVTACIFLIFGSFAQGPWLRTASALFAASVAVVAVLVIAARRQFGPRMRLGVGLAVVGLTGVSGHAYIQTVEHWWNVDSVATQQALWGATSTVMGEHRAAPTDTQQRPSRSTGIPEYPAVNQTLPEFNTAYYTGLLSVGGYLNLHGASSFDAARWALGDPATTDAANALLAAPGVVIGRGDQDSGLPSPDVVATCVSTGDCGGVTSEPLSYEPGNLLYRVTAAEDTRVIVNEAYYVGWSVLLVDGTGRTQELQASQGPAGMVAVEVPAGEWQLSLIYHTPLADVANALAAAGLFLIAAIFASGVRSTERWRRRGSRV